MDSHVEGKGTTRKNARDMITFTALDIPPKLNFKEEGTTLWAIPTRYELDGTTKVFTTVDQMAKLKEENGKATLSVEKTDAKHSISGTY